MEDGKEAKEAKEEIKDDGMIRWKNIGGSHRTKTGKIIKPNQKFLAKVEDIPDAFRDVIIPLDALPKEPPVEVAKPGYTVVTRSLGWFDVIDGNGKVVNEKALRAVDAQKLLGSLLE